MTDSIPENNAQETITQEKTQEIIASKKVEATTPTNANETKEPEQQEDPNWRAFREARKKDRADREAAERKTAEKEAEVAALKAAMEAAFAKGNTVSNNQSYSYQAYNTQEESETEDERIEKKVQAAIAQRETANDKARAEREAQEYPDRLNKAYPDFNSIITPENLDYLEFHHPEIARPLKRLGDNFDKWSDVYHTIKKFVPNATTAKRESARADSNMNKPKSISSTGLTQNTDAVSMRLSEDRKAQNWERMQKAIKGLG